MNREQSLELFEKGKDAWNAWAQSMREARAKLAAEEAWPEGDNFPKSKEALEWCFAATATFSEHTFQSSADFAGYEFPDDAIFARVTFLGEAIFARTTFFGKAEFREANFSGSACFDYATFSGHALFGRATFSDHTTFSEVTFSGNTEFQGATFSDDAWFWKATFSGFAGFSEATFSGITRFDDATFSGAADFSKSAFSYAALFREATFSKKAAFKEVPFSGHTQFSGATFSGHAQFSGATFSRRAEFQQSFFEGPVSFEGAQFQEAANFGAIHAKSGFSLAGTTFHIVPDFVETHFAEAPRLDNCRIEPGRSRPFSAARVKKSFGRDPDVAARWRALKRLAIQGHDHTRELAFFAGELEARRWLEDKPWHMMFWFCWFYQLFSDFGRSLLRPLIWWSVSVLFFAIFYIAQHPAFDKESLLHSTWVAIINIWWGISSVFEVLMNSGSEGSSLKCVAGSGEVWLDAIILSIQKGLLVPGVFPRDKVSQIYACLYGVHTADASQPSHLTGSFSAVIPNEVTLLGFVQYPLSAVLIFLLLLATRNHFRIK